MAVWYLVFGILQNVLTMINKKSQWAGFYASFNKKVVAMKVFMDVCLVAGQLPCGGKGHGVAYVTMYIRSTFHSEHNIFLSVKS